MEYSLVIDGHKIDCRLEKKRIKNINLKIKPDGIIYISAPINTDIEKINSFILEKSDFILKALEKFSDLNSEQPMPRLFMDGERVSLIGKNYELRVKKAVKNKVFFDNDNIVLWVSDDENLELKKKIFDIWIKSQASVIIGNMIEEIYPIFKEKGIDFPIIKYRKMVSRWGSCQPKKGILTFNTSLLYAPYECIVYVIVHEFTHFIVANHSREFYDEVKKVLPDYKNSEKLLKKIIIN